MAQGSEVQHPPVQTGFIIPSPWGVCGGVGAQVLLTPLNAAVEHKDAFLLGRVYRGRDLQPYPEPWDELSLFLLHSGVPPSSAACPLTSLSLSLVATTFTARVWHGSNLIPSALLCPPHTSSHRSAPVLLRVLLSPPCLLRASPTASAQPRWGRTARCCWHGSAHGLRTAWEGH